MKKRWFPVVMMGLVVAIAFTGCKTKRKRGGLNDNVGGVVGSELDIYGDPLGARPLDGSMQEFANQFMPVYFEYDSSSVGPSERVKVEEVASYMRSNPTMDIIVEGHCDERGSREYNMALGERRALAVRAYLIGLGIDGGRIQTKSYGEENPASMTHDEDGWAQNRRSEFVLFY
ncbi:MAG: peptidoglycan-associated lipoprotein Pal [Spartobacteria bacterium]|nr:peptidoglycan-associated lipoprotein Pal [Spartobacteria bacterium]